MHATQRAVVTVGGGGIGTVGSIKVGVEGSRRLAHVGIGAAKDVVGTHALVRCAVAVEIAGEGLGQRVVRHHGVGTVLPLQLLQLLQHLLMPLAARGKQQGTKP